MALNIPQSQLNFSAPKVQMYNVLQDYNNRFKRESVCSQKKGNTGGKGSFGFNSYNLLTFAILSYNIVSNIISNVNNNANNNNNNDNLYNFGSTNVAESSTSADNSNKNMIMITVPPAGPPIVVPTGKVLSNGSILLNKGLEEEGVSWHLPQQGWRVFDNGTIVYNETWREIGIRSFGVIDSENNFRAIRDLNNNLITWKKLRSLRNPRERNHESVSGSQSVGNNKSIDLSNYALELPNNIIDTIYEDL